MKKVGILTWHFGANYGAKAQAYALQKTIQNLGYETYIIDYRIKNYYIKNLDINLKFRSRLRHFQFHPILDLWTIKKVLLLETFNNRYNLTRRVKSVDDINNLGLDIVVLGSDAIFNTHHPFFRSVYYGVGLDKVQKITYSPSCESLDPNSNLSDEILKSLHSVKALSVRDISTQTLVENNIHRKSVITLDPTLLYDFNDIDAKPQQFNYPYILLYAFSDWEKYSTQIRKYANQHSLKIVSLGYYYKWADVNYVQCSFEEWVSMFRDASLVITDSFHGTVFSIKNSKEFVIIGRSDKNSKISSLLKDCDIQREPYNGDKTLEEYLNASIEYDHIRTEIDNKVQLSMTYLQNALHQK